MNHKDAHDRMTLRVLQFTGDAFCSECRFAGTVHDFSRNKGGQINSIQSHCVFCKAETALPVAPQQYEEIDKIVRDYEVDPDELLWPAQVVLDKDGQCAGLCLDLCAQHRKVEKEE